MFQIPAAPTGIPTSWKGHYFGRDGESLVPLSLQELETIRAQAAQTDWSAEICPDAVIGNLDEEALRIARFKFQAKYTRVRFGDEIDTWDSLTFLEKAKVRNLIQEMAREGLLRNLGGRGLLARWHLLD